MAGLDYMAAKKSKKRLFEDLAEIAKSDSRFAHFTDVNDKDKRLKHRKVSNETYGRNSCIYLYHGDKGTRRDLERLLEARGHRVDRGYYLGSGTLEVEVTYFKGFHWDE